MSLEKLIVVSSQDKDTPSDSNSRFTVSLKESYYTQNVLKIMVKDIIVPNVFYNVRGESYGSNQNNIFKFTTTLGDVTVTIPEGQYVISTLGVPPANDLLTVTENLINTALGGGSVSLSFDITTQKITFTWNTNVYGFLLKEQGNLAADIFGIGPNDPAQFGQLSQTPTYIASLNGLPAVYVHSKRLAEANGIDGDFGLISLVEDVSLNNAPFGSYAYKQNNDDELATILYDQQRNLNRIQITLRDNLGNVLDIGTNTMTVVFKVYLASG
jgi:hypothetical protein